MDKTRSLTDAIRGVLNDADDSLSARQVADSLRDAGVLFNEPSIKALLRQREVAGEFVKSEIAGNVVFTTNPEFVLDDKKARKHIAPKPKAAANPAPATFPPRLGTALAGAAKPADLNAASEAADRVIEAGDRELASQPPIEPAKAKRAPKPTPVAKAPAPARFLAERLDAIALDLADAIADACDAALPHALIKSLATANDATHRAARSLEA